MQSQGSHATEEQIKKIVIDTVADLQTDLVNRQSLHDRIEQLISNDATFKQQQIMTEATLSTLYKERDELQSSLRASQDKASTLDSNLKLALSMPSKDPALNNQLQAADEVIVNLRNDLHTAQEQVALIEQASIIQAATVEDLGLEKQRLAVRRLESCRFVCRC